MYEVQKSMDCLFWLVICMNAICLHFSLLTLIGNNSPNLKPAAVQEKNPLCIHYRPTFLIFIAKLLPGKLSVLSGMGGC